MPSSLCVPPFNPPPPPLLYNEFRHFFEKGKWVGKTEGTL